MEEILKMHKAPFDSLPPSRQVWNDKPGSHCEGLGRLVILTPDIVQSAASTCIRSGRRISLGWDMNKLDVANFNRQPAQHHIVPLLNGAAFDDIYIFNPQQSSQWDGLRHFSAPGLITENPARRIFYGGVEPSEITNRQSTRIGLQHWAKEGICGRGVLIDYARYAARHEINYSAFSDHSISLSTLQDVAREQNLALKFGDILFVRVGLVMEWDQHMTTAEKTAYATTNSPKHAGVEGTTELLRWIWDTGFAAVASDALSFEVYPPRTRYPRSNDQPDAEGTFMHETLLAKWGMPIGELFDLEGLSRICEADGRWDFFIASAPLNMPGGVSSPPNCVAIF